MIYFADCIKIDKFFMSKTMAFSITNMCFLTYNNVLDIISYQKRTFLMAWMKNKQGNSLDQKDQTNVWYVVIESMTKKFLSRFLHFKVQFESKVVYYCNVICQVKSEYWTYMESVLLSCQKSYLMFDIHIFNFRLNFT